MGTAPTERQYPAMPDPALMVRRSVGVLARLGLSEIAACDVILVTVNRIQQMPAEQWAQFGPWLDSIADHAVKRALASRPSQSDERRNDHAHG